jgi:Haem-degrading
LPVTRYGRAASVPVAVEVRRASTTVLVTVLEGGTADNLAWLRRKLAVVARFDPGARLRSARHIAAQVSSGYRSLAQCHYIVIICLIINMLSSDNQSYVKRDSRVGFLVARPIIGPIPCTSVPKQRQNSLSNNQCLARRTVNVGESSGFILRRSKIWMVAMQAWPVVAPESLP